MVPYLIHYIQLVKRLEQPALICWEIVIINTKDVNSIKVSYRVLAANITTISMHNYDYYFVIWDITDYALHVDAIV